MAWLSPAFPVGSFSYSHGLEAAVERGLVSDAGSLHGWICGLLQHGSAWTDAVLLAEAHRAAGAGDTLSEIAELGEAPLGRRAIGSDGDAGRAGAGCRGRRGARGAVLA